MKIKIAYNSSSKEFIHIDNAENGLKCNCHCIKCDEPLEARQGPIRKWHFKHHVNLNCTGSQETALHELAKQILLDNTQIQVPGKGLISYTDAIAEQRLEKLRPDISASYEGTPIYFEVFVSNSVNAVKEDFLIEGKHRSIEIDLRDCLELQYSEIKTWILDKIENKRIIFWEDESVINQLDDQLKTNDSVESKSNDYLGFGWLIALLVLLGIMNQRSKKNGNY
jgi:hypothetical protein